jgi:hypothetical protein
MAQTQATLLLQQGLTAALNASGWPAFALKYFLPIYDYRTDSDVHNSTVMVMQNSASVVSTTALEVLPGDIEGELLFKNSSDYYKINDNTKRVFSYNAPTVSSTNITASPAYVSSNTYNSKASDDSAPAGNVYVYEGSNLVSNGDGSFDSLTPFTSASVAPTSSWDRNLLYTEISYARGEVQPRTFSGVYTVKLNPTTGSFKFNKILLFLQKMTTAGLPDLTVAPVPFAVVGLQTTVSKYSTVDGDSANRPTSFICRVFIEFDRNTTSPVQLTIADDYWLPVSPTTPSSAAGTTLFYNGRVAVGDGYSEGYTAARLEVNTQSDSSDDLIRFGRNANTGVLTVSSGTSALLLYSTQNSGLSLSDNSVPSGIRSLAGGDASSATGNSSVAFGVGTSASGTASAAFGLYSVASGGCSFAWGSGKATGANSTAWGLGDASLVNSTAWGSGSATANCATAWGSARAFGASSTAWGSATTCDLFSTAWGSGCAVGPTATAWGNSSKACGGNSTSWGVRTTACGASSTSFGCDTLASGTDSTALGRNTTATCDQSTSWGILTLASGSRATAFGYGSSAVADQATAFGYNTYAVGNATAWGTGSFATCYYASAWGDSTLASGSNSTAFGWHTRATADGAVAWGAGALAIGVYSTAWGGGHAEGNRASAWGESCATAYRATAWGNAALASGENSTAFGSNVTASSDSAAAWGISTIASGGGATAWGVNTSASGSVATAWGANTTATGGQSTAFGNSNCATAQGATAWGYTTRANHCFSTALGFGDLTPVETDWAFQFKWGYATDVDKKTAISFVPVTITAGPNAGSVASALYVDNYLEYDGGWKPAVSGYLYISTTGNLSFIEAAAPLVTANLSHPT